MWDYIDENGGMTIESLREAVKEAANERMANDGLPMDDLEEGIGTSLTIKKGKNVKPKTANKKKFKKLTKEGFEELAKEVIREIRENPPHSTHYFQSGEKWYVDSTFINKCQGVIPGSELKHMGMGEFYLETPNGTIQFDRMGGKDFPGQVGRSHEMYDDVGGELVNQLISGMQNKVLKEAKKSRKLTKEGFEELAKEVIREVKNKSK